MKQRGSLARLPRKGDSACLLDQREYLVCFIREGNSACLADQRGSLFCFSHEEILRAWWTNEDLFSVFLVTENLPAW